MPRKRLDPLEPAVPQIPNVEVAERKENDIDETMFLSDAEILDISKSAVSNYYCVFEKIPNIIYFMKNFSFPSVTARTIDIDRPQHATKLPVFAHKLEFSDLSLNFLMDENFLTYFKFMRWMFENQYEFMKSLLEDSKERVTARIFHKYRNRIIELLKNTEKELRSK